MNEDPKLINFILDVLILIAGFWMADRYVKAYSGKGLFERYMEMVMKATNGKAHHKDDPQYLFEKLCQKADMKPIEVFKIARTEMGFGWSDAQVEKHLEKYVGEGCKELPNYVEAFVEKGKEHILEDE